MKQKSNFFKYLKYILLIITVISIVNLYLIYKNYVNNKSTNKNGDMIVDKNDNKISNLDETEFVNTVQFYDYEYIIPNIFGYSVEDDKVFGKKLQLYNNSEKWGAHIFVRPKLGEFTLESYNDALLKNNNDVKNGLITKIDDRDVIVFEYTFKNTLGLLAFTPAYDDNVYEIIIYDAEIKSLNFEVFDSIISMFKTAKKINN